MLKRRDLLLLISICFVGAVTFIGCAKGSARGCLGAVCPGADNQASTLPTTIQTLNTTNGSSFYCIASPVKSRVRSRVEEAPLKIVAVGGEAPYSVPGWVSSFYSQIEIDGWGYINDTNASIVTTRIATVLDRNGRRADCTFSLTVDPSYYYGGNTYPGALGCTFSMTPSNPAANQRVDFHVQAWGGNGSYSFGNFYAQYNTPVASTLHANGSLDSAVIYTVPGWRTAGVQVYSGGSSVYCSNYFNVRDTGFELLAKPGTSVQTGTAITVEPRFRSDTNCNGAVVAYTHTGGANVRLTQVGNVATFNALDGQSHSFDVTATVTYGSGVVGTPVTLHLNFTAAPALSCTMSISSPNFLTYENVTIRVTASEPIDIQSISVDGDAARVSSYLADPSIYYYSLPGTKSVSVTAKGHNSGISCNNGATLSQTFAIKRPLTSCDVVLTTLNDSPLSGPVVAGQQFKARASLPANGGIGPFTVIPKVFDFSNNLVTAPYEDDSDPLKKKIKILIPGNYRIELDVTDTYVSGMTPVTCNTYLVVN